MGRDEELVRRWRQGDRRAGTELLERYREALERFFANRKCDHQDVDDLVQRTFVGVTEAIERFRGQASVRTWMFAIGHNVLRQWRKERGRKHAREADLRETSLADDGAGMSTVLMNRRQQRMLLEALRQLSLEAQLALQLRYWDNVPVEEIGDILGTNLHGANYCLRKAKQDLQAVLDGLARERPLDSTLTSLEDWASRLRSSWEP